MRASLRNRLNRIEGRLPKAPPLPPESAVPLFRRCLESWGVVQEGSESLAVARGMGVTVQEDVEPRMRVDHINGRVEFFDSPNGPVHTVEWQRREVAGLVSSDAVSISIWARYHPTGFAWVSDPLFGAK